MTTSNAHLIAQAHERALANQPETKRRVNSAISALFGTSLIGTVAVGAVDLLPWWAVIAIGAVLAVGQVIAQAFSKASLAPSQVDALTSAAEEIDAEENPEPSHVEAALVALKESVDRNSQALALIKEREVSLIDARKKADASDPDDDLRTAYEGL